MAHMMSHCGNLAACPGLPVERLHDGQPILAPTARWWESGVTFNTAAVYLPRSTENDRLLARLLGPDALYDPQLRDGAVVTNYRARPMHDPGFSFTRSFTGLALFTPDTTTLLKRFVEPVVEPDADPAGIDHLGVEDPRVTQIGDTFYSVYCGVSEISPRGGWKANLCIARSRDLLNWEKLGAMRGCINETNNKDGVLFSETVDGRCLLLHRPMVGDINAWAMNLAISDAPDGDWHDCGTVLRAELHPQCRKSWVGAGSVPIPLGDNRYLVVFHTGHYLRDGRREYDLDAAIFNFNNFDPSRPHTIVEARVDRIMVPETDCEVNGPFPDSVANVLFTCGSYEYNGDLYILYGGGDTFVMSARMRTAALLRLLETGAACPREELIVV